VRSPKIGHIDAKIDVNKFDLLDELEAVADEDGHFSRRQLGQIKGRQRDIDTQYCNVHWRLLDHASILRWFEERKRANQPIVSPYNTKQPMGEDASFVAV